ncbi:hypothetical protein CMO89_01525 [Candidatus Woesearchaeota archaeon]|nr:hypothetical protein [Candidatus Woesearchaeota archaeon]|tara:strand:+ start:5586 stop:6143 length:558 start_codon:yes stop_codon:yes gene_type:complete
MLGFKRKVVGYGVESSLRNIVIPNYEAFLGLLLLRHHQDDPVKSIYFVLEGLDEAKSPSQQESVSKVVFTLGKQGHLEFSDGQSAIPKLKFTLDGKIIPCYEQEYSVDNGVLHSEGNGYDDFGPIVQNPELISAFSQVDCISTRVSLEGNKQPGAESMEGLTLEVIMSVTDNELYEKDTANFVQY